jgi:hypothetical protein
MMASERDDSVEQSLTFEQRHDFMQERYDYMHFDSNYKCDEYLINNLHILVEYKCCGGKGYATKKKNLPRKNIEKPIKPTSTEKGTCNICFVDECSLYSMCTCCREPFCMNCLKQLPTKSCPNCRSALRVF